MFLQPWMVGRTLDREIERDLQSLRMRLFDQTVEIVEAAQLGMNGVMATRLVADRIRASGIRGAGGQRVVGTFRFARPIGWIGGK